MEVKRNEPVRIAGMFMRSRWELLLADTKRDTSDLRAAGEEALVEVREWERLLSAFDPHSDLFRVNERAALEPVQVDNRLIPFLLIANALTCTTKGAFDLTVGPLLRAWQIASDSESKTDSPGEKEIQTALGLVGMNRVVQINSKARTIAFSKAGVRLDPGAIGKGWAADQATEILRDAGVDSALLHGGTSTVFGLGSPPEQELGWPIAIEHPICPGEALVTVTLRDKALGVSAVSGKTVTRNGRTWGHVVDPRTGQPVYDTLLAAVVSPSATEADALSTALLVLGAGGISMLAPHFPQTQFLVAETAPQDINRLALTIHGDGWNTIAQT